MLLITKQYGTQYYILYGRECCTPLDIQFDWPEDFTPPQDEHEYTAKLQGRLQDAYDDINKRLQTYTQRMKNRYNVKVRPIHLSEGKLSWPICPRRRKGRCQKCRRLRAVCFVE
jgi:hypothetical protein